MSVGDGGLMAEIDGTAVVGGKVHPVNHIGRQRMSNRIFISILCIIITLSAFLGFRTSIRTTH
jgi:uncharacterized membrane protein YeiB